MAVRFKSKEKLEEYVESLNEPPAVIPPSEPRRAMTPRKSKTAQRKKSA